MRNVSLSTKLFARYADLLAELAKSDSITTLHLM
ncbi:hypothetical protein F480_02135 [Bibersteinia trehalosi Y31]|nr:hypothetical protein F480_02135 [Bibersteinia trehalosi Y31]